MKKIIILCTLSSLISTSTFGMIITRKALSTIPTKNNNIFATKLTHRTQFNRTELLQQLEEEKNRFTADQMAFLRTMITNLSTELPCEPGKTKDRDFEHGNMNK